MRGFLLGSSVSIAFVIGCAASQVVVPPASAAPAQRWEYECVAALQDTPLTTHANELGKAGWEMTVAVSPSPNHAVVCFKRRLP